MRIGLWLLGSLLVGSCYNPQIVSGGLKCTSNFECPSKFVCSQADGLCYREGEIPTAGAGGSTGGMGGATGGASGGMGGATGGSGGTCAMPMAPYGPFASCTPSPDAKGCDPVCQSGCGCTERCKLESGNNVCRAEGPNFLTEYAACEPRDDRCRPGTICLQESQDHPACGARCYRHCRSDADCPNAKCSVEVQFGASATKHKVCSPPMDACNPWGQATCSPASGRAQPTFGCYVMSSVYPDIPICDCAGNIPIGQQCMYEHECVPGAECVLANGLRACRRVCKVGVPPMSPVPIGGCGVGNMMTCVAFPGSSQFGYCR
jgi:hypothetical protein